jgi:protein-S-isoprenylcysteine O-methyltransferase Ste14
MAGTKTRLGRSKTCIREINYALDQDMSGKTKSITPRVIIQLLLFIGVVPLLPLLISGNWLWWEAWVYAILCILGFVVSRVLAGRRHPGLLSERARFMRHADALPWDKVLAPLLSLGGGFMPLVAGLDARFSWSPAFILPVKLAALAVILAGYALASNALIENRYFSGVVRIQADRDHHVVSSGPYRWMRQPGYAGALLTYLGTPVFLDAVTAFLPTAILLILLVIRTYLEDTTLQERLAGYGEYTREVPYRLLPGVW